jgi:hypothetical protein
MFGGDAFGVELDRVDRQIDMPETHDCAIIAGGVDRQAIWHINHFEAVIAGGGERRWQTRKQAGAIMADGRGFAVHQMAALHRAAEMLANGLMAEADTEQGAARLGAGTDQFEADASFIGGAGTGGNEDGVRARRQGFGSGERVITFHADFCAQFNQIMHQIEGEAVIIVDDEDHIIAHIPMTWRG